MNIVRVNYTYCASNRSYLRGVDHPGNPFPFCYHFIVDSLKVTDTTLAIIPLSLRYMSSGRITTSRSLAENPLSTHLNTFPAKLISKSFSITRQLYCFHHKPGYKGITRFIVNILRRSDLLHQPAVHHNNCVGHCECFFLIMGDIDECDAELLLDIFSSSCISLRSSIRRLPMVHPAEEPQAHLPAPLLLQLSAAGRRSTGY